jgi:DEAD/DEAH box helicase domain-containing protein
MNVAQFIDHIRTDFEYRGQIAHIEQIPPRPPAFGALQRSLPRPLENALHHFGIQQLYTHQTQAIDAARAGQDVVVVTGTASGKTLCYNLPVLERILQNPRARAFYVYPTKALSQDQLRGLLRFNKESDPALPFQAGVYDGDTPTPTRTTLRNKANIILTNPDMLHAGILPQHARWGAFFSNLQFVVVDEIHSYRGIFGSNVANVLRRLQRIAAHYGAKPQFICSSATIANPVELAERLTGRTGIKLVDNDGSPRGAKKFVFWNPPLLASDERRVTSDAGRSPSPVARHPSPPTMERRSPNTEAQWLMVRLIRERVPTITFVKARVLAELIFRYCQDELRRVAPSLANAIRAYRGGYLPEERREIERQLFNGELLGVTSTNALELGIDVGSLDACLMVGYPGSVSSTWQRAGRAGRRDSEALVVLIGQNNPIDQYLIHHADYFFGQSHEHAIVDGGNPHILVGHLRCAAQELPLSPDDLKPFGDYAQAVAEILEENGHLKWTGGKFYFTQSGMASKDVNLRDIGDNTYIIVDTTRDNRTIGTLDEWSAYSQLHDQAVYMHNGETYFVDRLDLSEKVAYIHKADVDYFTQALTETKIRVDEEELRREFPRKTNSAVAFGSVTVTDTVMMFKKIKFHTLENIGYGNLKLPLVELPTQAAWFMPDVSVFARVKKFGRAPYEGMLGIANVITQVVPLVVICDPMDIGSVVDSANTGTLTLFVYDKYPGGLGFAHKTFERMEEILESSRQLITECPCEDGCPSCVGSARRTYSYRAEDGEARERIPDKHAALIILHEMLGQEPYVPPGMTEAGVAGYQEDEEQTAWGYGSMGATAKTASTAHPSTPPRSQTASRPAPEKRLPASVEEKVREQVKRLQQRGEKDGN